MMSEGKTPKKHTGEPMEEKQDQGVTVKLGKTHYDALVRWSKERFGLPNAAGVLRLLVHEKWLEEQKKEEIRVAS